MFIQWNTLQTKKKINTFINNMDISQSHYFDQKYPEAKKYNLYNSITLMSKKTNTRFGDKNQKSLLVDVETGWEGP
jgi:hypothetical protein